MKVKVIDYNIRNWPIRWQILARIKVILEHFSLAFIIFEILIFHISAWPWKCRSRSWCTTFAVAPFDGTYMISYLMAIVMFELFQRLLVKIATWKIWSWKFRSRWLNALFEMVPLDSKNKRYKSNAWAFFASSHSFRYIDISQCVTLKI